LTSGRSSRASNRLVALIALAGALATAQDSKPDTAAAGDSAATIARLMAEFEKSPKDLAVNLGLAEAYLGAGDLRRARRHADRAQAVAPADPRGSLWVGHVLFRMADDVPEGAPLARATFADSAAAYEEALALGADPYATAFWAADARERAGEVAKALTSIEGALRARPDDPAAALVKGRLLIAEGRAREAEGLFDRVVLAAPGTPVAGQAAVEAIRARLLAGDLGSIPDAFTRLTRHDPHGAAARIYRLLAESWRGTRDEDLWATLLEAAARASPDDPLATYWRAELAARRKDGAATLALAERYRKASPGDPDGRVFVSIGLRLLGRLDEARVEIGRAYDRFPDHGPIREEMQYLVKAFFDARRYREAADVQELVAHTTGTPADRYDYAVLRLDGGMKDEARRLYEALGADSEAPAADRSRARNALGLLRLGEGDLAGAEQALRRALEEDPDNLDAHENLGILLVRQGKVEDGRKELGQAVARSPKTDPLRKRSQYHLWRAEHPEVP
jgi:tetratricopeptide (TPR) repeat protein